MEAFYNKCHLLTQLLMFFGSLYQWRSQNAENVTHVKGRLPAQAVILFNCVAFQNGNFS